MNELGPRQQDRVEPVAKGRDQNLAPEQRQQARDCQQNERPRQHPVGKAFDRLEPRHRAPRHAVFDPHATTEQEEHRQNGQRAQQQPAAIGRQRPAPHVQPPHAAVLHQNLAARVHGGHRHVGLVIAQGAPLFGVRCAAQRPQTRGRACIAADVVAAKTVVHLQTLLAAQHVLKCLRAPGGRTRRRIGAHRVFGRAHVLCRGDTGQRQHRE